MVKYKEVIKDMLETHKELFDSFKEIHDKFTKNPKEYKKQFNEEGQDILRIIQKWENILCSKSESGKYGKFSSGLSDKFWAEIRQLFPLIGKVGEM